MIAYLDTSVLVPLLIAEPSSPACAALWDTADDVVTSQLAYVEGAAALAAARHAGRITRSDHRAAVARLDDVWSQISVVPVDETLVAHAARLSDTQALRGYDAVHCASAVAVSDVDMVAAAGDRRLLDAWHDLGLATVDVTR
ncbi:type II toxin-antitoxin system VapC family toxin [Aeromicrobium sp. Root472D3]|uniref:type II toxin-antitoxin system VapC family toxin n=1 Tax=Aeromicrobium sp. Root472D3 TaxID=1736540 RepID=UPI0006FE5DFF|nr:type II toxin-antitoxin system VapC family toxin [Aeromicrobium sp. Root472D3]KQX74280.1 twitching motility protein PilT [Aeromicrobium sp. Root472D3]